MTRQQLKVALGLKDDERFRKAYLLPALEAGVVAMTIPDKPRSKQKYRLTDKDCNREVRLLPGKYGDKREKVVSSSMVYNQNWSGLLSFS